MSTDSSHDPGSTAQAGRSAAAEGMRGSATPVEIAQAMVRVLDGSMGMAGALATVIGRSGSAPQVVGARLLLLEDDTIVGTVGGGAIEAQVLEGCRSVLRRGRPTRIEAHLVRDLGMCCGGSMEVFVEYLQPRARLFVIGAGHVAQALVPLAVGAGFAVTVLDDREDILGHPSLEQARRLAYDVDELDDAVPDLGEQDFVLIVTRDHARDEKALAGLLRRPHGYIGMIGSRRKVHTVLSRILRREKGMGRSLPDLSRVRAPVGLSLRGRTPFEIAISICAEFVAARHGGDGSAMNVIDDVVAALDLEPPGSG